MWPWSVACSHRQKLLYTCQSPRSLAAASTIFSRYKTLMSANIQDSCIRITADKGSPRPWFSKAHIDISDDNSEVMQCGASSCLNVATRTRPRNPTNSISHSVLTMSYFDQNQALMIVNFELLSLYSVSALSCQEILWLLENSTSGRHGMATGPKHTPYE